MGKIYRYILVTDDGMAPCLTGGVVSLATCKPVVRRVASLGDWILGFVPGSYQRGLVVWAGKVGAKHSVGRYQELFGGRDDAVYAANDDGTFRRLRLDYHDDLHQQAKDTSNPVLLFDTDHTWYFGLQPRQLPPQLMHLAPAGQGHRVHGVGPDDERLLAVWLAECEAPGYVADTSHHRLSRCGSGCDPSARVKRRAGRC